MVKEISARPDYFNSLAASDFEYITNDSTLDDVFYLPNERLNYGFGISSTILAGPEFHPLHPNFVRPNRRPIERGLLGGIRKRSIEINIDYEALNRSQVARIEEHWRKVRSHVVYRWLAADQNFGVALRLFQQTKESAPSNSKYTHEFADFRFCRISGYYIGTFVANGRKGLKRATAKDKESVIWHIDKLLKDFQDHEIGFDDSYRNHRFKLELIALRDVVEKKSESRADRTDDAQGYRRLNEALTIQLERTFGRVSPKLIESLSAVAGGSLDTRTIQNHIAKAKGRKKTSKKRAIRS
jgi:Uri superfamily endonuclease